MNIFFTSLHLPFKSCPEDFACSISLRNFRISEVPFSMMSLGGNSMGLLLIFRPFKLFIKPKTSPQNLTANKQNNHSEKKNL